MCVDEVPDALLAGSLELANLVAALVDLEGGHALDAGGLSSVGSGVDVNLVEGNVVGTFGSDLSEDGADSLAGWAPGSGEVNDHGFVGGCGLGCVELS